MLLCNRCACNWKITSQIINVYTWRVHRKYVVKVPELHKTIPARKPCVRDALCNWKINSLINKHVCNHFRPHSTGTKRVYCIHHHCGTPPLSVENTMSRRKRMHRRGLRPGERKKKESFHGGGIFFFLPCSIVTCRVSLKARNPRKNEVAKK